MNQQDDEQDVTKQIMDYCKEPRTMTEILNYFGFKNRLYLKRHFLDEMLSEEEKILAAHRCTLFTELTPKQKAQIVKILQDNDHSVGFLGDGMNDLPVIVEADVGISVDLDSDVVK